MIRQTELGRAADLRLDDLLKIAGAAVDKAQAESRRQGVPNVYCIDGRILCEQPTGELAATDPYLERENRL